MESESIIRSNTPSEEEMTKIQQERDAYAAKLINEGAKVEVTGEQIEDAKAEMDRSIDSERKSLKIQNEKLESENDILRKKLEEMEKRLNHISQIAGGNQQETSQSNLKELLERIKKDIDNGNLDSEIERVLYEINRDDLTDDQKSEIKSSVIERLNDEFEQLLSEILSNSDSVVMDEGEFNKIYKESNIIFSVPASEKNEQESRSGIRIVLSGSHDYHKLDFERDLAIENHVKEMKKGNVKAIQVGDKIYFVKK